MEMAGHDPRSPYAETYWTASLGPTAILLLRRVAGWLEASPEGVAVPLPPLARELGLGEGKGRNSPVMKCLARAVEFNMARVQGEALAVRRMLPPLARGHENRLPAHLLARHRAELEALALSRLGTLRVRAVDAAAFAGAGERRPPWRVASRLPANPTPAAGPLDGRSAA